MVAAIETFISSFLNISVNEKLLSQDLNDPPSLTWKYVSLLPFWDQALC